MQVAVLSSLLPQRPFRSLPMHLRVAACCGAMALSTPAFARAANNNGVLVDAHMIASLQLRAQQAEPRDQVQMYADLADKISLLASKQIADGEEEAAQETLHQLEACTAVIESGLSANSRGLKRTELLLHMTNRRLTDMVRSGSGEIKPLVQSTLKHMEKTQTALLGAIFEK
jgi:hypothetical protein